MATIDTVKANNVNPVKFVSGQFELPISNRNLDTSQLVSTATFLEGSLYLNETFSVPYLLLLKEEFKQFVVTSLLEKGLNYLISVTCYIPKKENFSKKFLYVYLLDVADKTNFQFLTKIYLDGVSNSVLELYFSGLTFTKTTIDSGNLRLFLGESDD